MDFCTLHTVEKIQWEEETNYYDCQNTHCVTFFIYRISRCCTVDFQTTCSLSTGVGIVHSLGCLSAKLGTSSKNYPLPSCM